MGECATRLSLNADVMSCHTDKTMGCPENHSSVQGSVFLCVVRACARVPLICHKTVGNAISSLGAVVLSRNASLCFCLAAILQGKIWPLAFRCSAVHGANSCLYVAASANHNLELFCLAFFVFRRCAVAPTPLHVLRGHRSLVFHIGWLPYRGAVGV